ncbi:histidine phosphatase family protein [Lactiplantibacillus fabifermentans]|uniref:Phosphoglycerate mutase n=2 Tax=Lactiplantibacillus fabifermentans TaxID=483011 RepID=A0A0R2N9I0_9LACO|nr:histidine phosphatase family protein [Lactiplantibacillus fabifermentans]ETY75175.1 phosphoglycerate kinase [Lactiplantibacillus fabifermentans T30PCM01]KRO22485.1 hypothetical protein DY78_GL002003 [Lactiplantibacillus fabifermentans DSM 21115]
MQQLILIQHPEAQHHLNGMVGSWTDWPLTAAGEATATQIGKKLAPILAAHDFESYCSDLTRTSQTIAALPVTDVHFSAQLREQNLGVAVGQTRQWEFEHAQEVHDKSERRFEGAESELEFEQRVQQFYEQTLCDNPHDLLVVSHGGWLRKLMPLLMGQPAVNVWGAPGGVSWFERNVGETNWYIKRINDLSLQV